MLNSSQHLPSEIITIIPWFEKRQYLCKELFQIGKAIDVTIVPADKITPERATRQRADSICDPLLPEFFCLSVGGRDLGVSFNSSAPAQEKRMSYVAPPKTRQEKKSREDCIREDIDKIAAKLSRRAHPLPDLIYPDFKGEKYLWIGDRLIRPATPDSKFFSMQSPSFNESLFRAVKILDSECKKRNIDLIVLSIPDHNELYAPDCATNLSVDDAFSARRLCWIMECLKNDIEIIDLYDVIHKRKNEFPEITMVAFNDSHWDSGFVQIAADEITRRLSRYDICRNPTWAESQLSIRKMDAGVNFPVGNAKYSGRLLHDVIFLNDKLILREKMPKAKILLLGDSYTNTPYTGLGSATLPAWLMYKLRQPVETNRRNGSLALIMNLQKDNFKILDGAYVCILVFSPGYQHSYWYYFDQQLLDEIKRANLIADVNLSNCNNSSIIMVSNVTKNNICKYTITINKKHISGFKKIFISSTSALKNGEMAIFTPDKQFKVNLKRQNTMLMSFQKDSRWEKYGLTFYITVPISDASTRIKIYGLGK